MTRSGKKQVQMKLDNKIRPITDHDPKTITAESGGRVQTSCLHFSYMCTDHVFDPDKYYCNCVCGFMEVTEQSKSMAVPFLFCDIYAME